MISTMGDADGNGKGDFILIDAEEGVVKGTSSVKCQTFMYITIWL